MRCGRKYTVPPDVFRANHYVNAVGRRGSGRANDTSDYVQDGSVVWAAPYVDARTTWPAHIWHTGL